MYGPYLYTWFLGCVWRARTSSRLFLSLSSSLTPAPASCNRCTTSRIATWPLAERLCRHCWISRMRGWSPRSWPQAWSCSFTYHRYLLRRCSSVREVVNIAHAQVKRGVVIGVWLWSLKLFRKSWSLWYVSSPARPSRKERGSGQTAIVELRQLHTPTVSEFASLFF